MDFQVISRCTIPHRYVRISFHWSQGEKNRAHGRIIWNSSNTGTLYTGAVSQVSVGRTKDERPTIQNDARGPGIQSMAVENVSSGGHEY